MQIFKYIEDHPDKIFVLRASFFEIYNEVVHDLLQTEGSKLRIREDKKRGVFVDGLKQETVMRPEQVLALLKAGQSHRHIGRTNYNSVLNCMNIIKKANQYIREPNYKIIGIESIPHYFPIGG